MTRRHRVAAWIGGSVIVPVVVGVIVEKIAPFGLADASKRCIGALGSVLGYGLTLPVWSFFALVGALLLTRRIMKSVKKPIGPEFHEYVRDSFLGATWQWRWSRDNSVIHLLSICPKCSYELRVVRAGYRASGLCMLGCDHCDYRTPTTEFEGLTDRVIREIHRKIRTGEWRADA